MSTCASNGSLTPVIKIVLLTAVLATAVPVSAAQQIDSADEVRLKAAFVFRFPQFVEWPAHAIAGRDSLGICVQPLSPLRSALQELVVDEAVGGRRLIVHEVDDDGELAPCDVLVLTPGAPGNRRLLKRASTRAVLTVSDEPGFLDAGGVIQLRMVERRVRFEVDARRAATVGLSLSSQLLRLATHVRGER